jgi:hypothetical protein
MAEGRLKAQWDQTAQVIAILANIHRARGAPAVNAENLNPYRRPQRLTKEQTGRAILEAFGLGKGGPNGS